MKLIIAGPTGFVATEVIKQGLSHPAITSIVALARRTTSIPQDLDPAADATKLKSVVCDDFENYPESVKQELAGADACICCIDQSFRLIAITPSQLNTMSPEEARKICFDYTVSGLKTITKLPRNTATKPFRFLYVSGANAERDQTKKPWLIGDYCLMRGEVESHVLDYAKESGGTVEVGIARPGLIDAPGKRSLVMSVLATIGCAVIGLPWVENCEVAATLLKQVVEGVEKETLLNEDLVRIGREELVK
ncbi:nucleoside-diphosphate-sugar epimerase protein [Rutstroemia sp. NJR-2017a BBW]|nr:nucleoside-diphosphate-sugar epimerase protein [Rutstroemia sp. NJR-2017a BBW]